MNKKARTLVESLIYLAEGGLFNAAKIFARSLNTPVIERVMQKIPQFTMMSSKDQEDLDILKKIMGNLSLVLNKVLVDIS